MSFLLIATLTIAASAQSNNKKSKAAVWPVRKSKVITNESTSSFDAKANITNNTSGKPVKTIMLKPRHHYKAYKAKQKILN